MPREWGECFECGSKNNPVLNNGLCPKCKAKKQKKKGKGK